MLELLQPPRNNRQMCLAVCLWPGLGGRHHSLAGPPPRAAAVPFHGGACCFVAPRLADGGPGSMRAGGKESSTSASLLCPNVPLCTTLKPLLSPAQHELFIALAPLSSPEALCCCRRPVSPTHVLSQAPTAHGIGKVHVNPLPTQSRGEKGVWC